MGEKKVIILIISKIALINLKIKMLKRVKCWRCPEYFLTDTPPDFKNKRQLLKHYTSRRGRKNLPNWKIDQAILEQKSRGRCDKCKKLLEEGDNRRRKENKTRWTENNKTREIALDAQKKVNTFWRKLEKLEDKVFPKKEPPKTIYDFNTIYHWIGWPIFLILAGYIGKKVYRTKYKKKKPSKDYLAEILAIFKEWKLNMYASTAIYVVGFYLIQQGIDKWINPRISGWLATQKLITISAVCLIIGGGFYLDGIITSSLKTPLQRLGIRIENANIDEKIKKDLLSKTQQVNELFKETLKRFGLLAVVGILTYLIREHWNKNILTYLSYAVPIAGAIKIIWEVDKTLKKIKLRGSKKI
jgi:hypothetical protein